SVRAVRILSERRFEKQRWVRLALGRLIGMSCGPINLFVDLVHVHYPFPQTAVGLRLRRVSHAADQSLRLLSIGQLAPRDLWSFGATSDRIHCHSAFPSFERANQTAQ